MSFATRRGEVTATMAPSNLGYSIKEANRHFFRNWTTSLGAVITIFLSLFIIGLFIVGSAMVNAAIGSVEQEVTINAFISDDAADDDIKAFESELKSWDNVKNVTFKTKEDALSDYKSKVSNNADATMSALDGENPLPRSFVIEMEDPSQVASTATKIKQSSSFRKIVDDENTEVDDKDADVEASVLYGREEVGRLFQVTNYIRIAAIVVVALLTFIAFIFINNTIRLSITARRREIAIMRLVGRFERLYSWTVYHRGRFAGAAGVCTRHWCAGDDRNVGIPALQNSIKFLTFAIPIQMFFGDLWRAAYRRRGHWPVWLCHRYEALP